jgi:hypothetical protein
MKRREVVGSTVLALAAALACAPQETVSTGQWDGRHWGDSLFIPMEEPPLNGSEVRTPPRETVRFLWIRTFDAPVAIRLEREGGAARLVTTVLSGKGGDPHGHVVRRDSVALSITDFERLTGPLHRASFWRPDRSDRVDSSRKVLTLRLDGSTWVVERRLPSRYWVRTSWSPVAGGRDSHVHAFGVRLLQAAGLTSEEVY